jgi:metallophosphoesterase superfamily enzyme
VPPFVLAHHPVPSGEGYVIAGHVHPGVRLHGAGRQRERLPCFTIGLDVAILPAFGDFTGLAHQDPCDSADVYAIAENRVIEVKH